MNVKDLTQEMLDDLLSLLREEADDDGGTRTTEHEELRQEGRQSLAQDVLDRLGLQA